MSWKTKLLAAFFGLILLGTGLWPLGTLCLLYLAYAMFPRSRPGRAPRPYRLMVGAFLILLAAAALVSGGTYSPVVLLVSGLTLLVFPKLSERLTLFQLVPVEGSILLRSRYLPLTWAAVAEVKPTSDDFSRSASALGGTLMVATDTGRTYSVVSCHATVRSEAEARIFALLSSVAMGGRPNALLLPLDSVAAAQVLSPKLARVKANKKDFADAVAAASGLVVVECAGGFVLRGGLFNVAGVGAPRLPPRGDVVTGHPLAWEVFSAIGKKTKWPDPDGYSDLLDSMAATRGVPLGERIREFGTVGSALTVSSLSGERLETTRAQLRAIVTIYG